ncbi:PREDICTED: muscle M-line assembly protein unc-89 [Tarenaya hassleriana]|uniref:muscle M-line assembly protein unc-89 n=1 Tax=Tarenaya hassleriana TaxID=28532 RepID=UPI00053C9BCD|nr:PREDICTED: muscle M-line assembly protein unc-89 [Tarenaya hassleriana]
MAASDNPKELQKQLTEAGKKILDPPSSVEDLLPLLDKVESCLTKVDQSPPDSMQNVLSPLMKALVADRLFKHSDIDVNAAVAACISEITRITAPDAPYDDDQMKEVFQLIVSSFENLTDISSRSYSKRTSILETVARVQSCVVMLDLECDALVIEMFQHFLKTIRDNHPDNVFSSMETIMTLVLEESEEISPELLSPILEYVRKDNQVPQISRKLAEQVLKNSATKLKPYLTDAIKSLGLSLDKFSDVAASICKGTFGESRHNESVANEKHDSQDNLTREVEDEDKLNVPKVADAELADAPKDGSLKSEVSNGVAQVAENDSSDDTDSKNKQDDTKVKDEPPKPDKFGDSGIANAGDEKETGVENQQSKKNRKQTSSVRQEEFSKASNVKEETESRAPLDNPDISSDNEKVTSAQALESKPADETTNAASPSQSECLPNDSNSNKAVNQKKKESSTKEAKSSAGSSAKVAPEEPSSSEVNSSKRSGKKVVSSSKTKASVPTKKSIPEAKPTKQSGKKAVDSDNVEVPSKSKEDKKKQGHGKVTGEKEKSHTSSDDDEKPIPKSSKDEVQPFEETPNTNGKRKHNLDKEKASEDKEFGENLVGSRVKIWWPKDRAYYEGVVNSYDVAKKKHLVLYDDGDQEILNLRRQKWEFIEDESESTAMDEKGDQTGPDESSAMPQKKKAKRGNGHSAMQRKAETPVKKGAASKKSKAVASATKSGKKTEEVGKMENRSKSSSKKTRSGKKPEDGRTESKTKDTTSKEASKAEHDDSSDEMSVEEDEEKLKSISKSAKAAKSGKAKEDAEVGTSKHSSKKKEEPTKSSSKSKTEPAKSIKGKTGKGTGKSSGKPKSASAPTTSSKDKESNRESDSEDNPTAPETSSSKGKSPVSAKMQGKSGKKRKR